MVARRGDGLGRHRRVRRPAVYAVTVGAYSSSWLTGKVSLKPKTRASYESLLLTRVLPQWRDVPLGRVTYEAVTVWVASMASGLPVSYAAGVPPVDRDTR